jgi:hypothetical protein
MKGVPYLWNPNVPRHVDENWLSDVPASSMHLTHTHSTSLKLNFPLIEQRVMQSSSLKEEIFTECKCKCKEILITSNIH